MFKKYKIAQSAAKFRMGEGSTTKVNNKFMVIEKRKILKGVDYYAGIFL